MRQYLTQRLTIYEVRRGSQEETFINLKRPFYSSHHLITFTDCKPSRSSAMQIELRVKLLIQLFSLASASDFKWPQNLLSHLLALPPNPICFNTQHTFGPKSCPTNNLWCLLCIKLATGPNIRVHDSLNSNEANI